MKAMKKTLSILVVLVLLISALGMTVLATEVTGQQQTGTITVNASADGVKASDRTLKAYRILNFVPDSTGTSGRYTIVPGLEQAFKDAFSQAKLDEAKYDALTADPALTALTTEEQALTGDKLSVVIVDKIDQLTTAHDIEAFARYMAKNVGSAPVITLQGQADGSAKADNLYLGYYIIKDETTLGNDKVGESVSAVMLNTTNTAITVTLKTSKNDVPKVIDGAKDHDDDTTGASLQNSAASGDYIPFEVGKDTEGKQLFKIPDTRGYDTYYFYLEDTLDPGLTFCTDADKADGKGQTEMGATDTYTDGVIVTQNGKQLTGGAKPSDTNGDGKWSKEEWGNIHYYVVAPTVTAPALGGGKLQIIFNPWYILEQGGVEEGSGENATGGHAGEALIVRYVAQVNANASTQDIPNKNSVKLIYNDTPGSDGGGEKNPGEPHTPTGGTPEKTTYTYTTELYLKKVDGATPTTTLAGALFKVESSSFATAVITGTSYEKDDAGAYYLLNDGSYTKEAPNGDSTHDAAYKSTTDKYKQVVLNGTEASAPVSNSYTIETGSDGIIHLKGLNAGTYTFTEIKAPDGYNKLTPDSFTITIDFHGDVVDPATGKLKEGKTVDDLWTYSSTLEGYNAADAQIKVQTGINDEKPIYNPGVQVENKQGQELPSTGGIGTTIFYAVGTILVLSVLIYFVAKKRTEAEEH